MYGGLTVNVVLLTIFQDSLETYGTIQRRIFTEFERKVDVQNHKIGWVRFQNPFLIIK